MHKIVFGGNPHVCYCLSAAVISFADAKSLYCTARDWTASLTPFCEISY